jgi:hypothetical protein
MGKQCIMLITDKLLAYDFVVLLPRPLLAVGASFGVSAAQMVDPETNAPATGLLMYSRRLQAVQSMPGSTLAG